MNNKERLLIEDGVLIKCLDKDIEALMIPEEVKSIGDLAFCKCEKLRTLIIPSNVISIGKCAFKQCISLKTVSIEEGLTSIGDAAFWGCVNLVAIVLPKSLKTIGAGAFAYCENLSTLILLGEVEEIGKAPFNHCQLLQKSKATNKYYKAFNADMTCLNHKGEEYRFEVDRTYHLDNIKIHERGFHSCGDILEVFTFHYGVIDEDVIICEVEAFGDMQKSNLPPLYDTTPSLVCSSDIKIVRKLSRQEIIELINR